MCRIAYKWFLFLHKLSYVLGIAGYFVIMGALLGFNMLFGAKIHQWMDTGMLLLFYGLYYGVLGRDFADVCTSQMASQIGVRSVFSLPTQMTFLFSIILPRAYLQNSWKRTCAQCAVTTSPATRTRTAFTPMAKGPDQRPSTDCRAAICAYCF